MYFQFIWSFFLVQSWKIEKNVNQTNTMDSGEIVEKTEITSKEERNSNESTVGSKKSSNAGYKQ